MICMVFRRFEERDLKAKRESLHFCAVIPQFFYCVELVLRLFDAKTVTPAIKQLLLPSVASSAFSAITTVSVSAVVVVVIYNWWSCRSYWGCRSGDSTTAGGTGSATAIGVIHRWATIIFSPVSSVTALIFPDVLFDISVIPLCVSGFNPIVVSDAG